MDTSVKYVTVDTNIYQDPELINIGRALPYIHLYSTRVSEEELGKPVVLGYQLADMMWGEPWDLPKFEPNRAIPTAFTIGTSVIGDGTIPNDDTNESLVKAILKIVTNGGVVYPRDIGSKDKGIRNNIKDALILQAHCIRRHHILVSNDYKFFGREASDKRRLQLEHLCETTIMSSSEFKKEFGAHMASSGTE